MSSENMKTFLVKHDEEKKDIEQLFEVKIDRELVGHIARKGTRWVYHTGTSMPQDMYTAPDWAVCASKDDAVARLSVALLVRNDRSKVN